MTGEDYPMAAAVSESNSPMSNVIVIVDDNPGICRVLIRCLRHLAVAPECIANGLDALAKMETAQPALVFLDYMMPDMNGLEVLRRMGASEKMKSIPVVMFTANDTESVREEAKLLGAIGYLVKGQASGDDFRRYVQAATVLSLLS